MRTILNIALVALVAIPGMLQTGAGTVQGIVRRPDTKQPLARVSVRLGGGEVTATIVTDETGRFRFSNRPSGPFSIRATKEDFFPAKAQPGDRSNIATYFGTLGAPANEADLVIELVPAGRIAGRVLTARGEPLADATFGILVDAYEDGRHVLARFQPPLQNTLKSNDRGEFRIFGLVPGRYYLLAQTSASIIQFVRGQNREFAVPRMTYYPGTLQPGEARPILVQPNADAAVSFSMVEPLPTTITGRVAGASLPARPRLSLSVVQRNFDVSDATDSGVALAPPIVNERGEFEMALARPGSFELFAVLANGNQPQSWYAGRTSIRVPGVTQDVEIRLAPIFNLQVRIVGNGDATVEAQIPTAFRIRPYEQLPSNLQPNLVAAPSPVQPGRGMATAEQRRELLERNRAARLDW